MIKIKQTLLLPLIGILVFGTNCNSSGQTQKIDKVEIVQNFKVGKSYKYEVQRGKVDSMKPETENVKSSTDVEFKVLNKKDSFKECSWKYGSTKIIGISSDQIDEQNRKMLNIHQGIEVKFLIDKSGTIQEIINYEECKTYIENRFKLIFDNAANKTTPEQLEKIISALKYSYETPEILVSTYCPELIAFFTMFGETVKSDSIYISQSDLPNPFGGRSFPTNVTTKIDSVADNIAIISVRQIIPSEDLNSIMKETFIELSKQSDKPFSENDIPKMNMKTCSTFNFDYKKNVLKEVYAEKLIEADGVKQTQTLKVILKN